MIKIQLVQDDDSHWYLIPNKLVNEFYQNLENEDFVDNGRFDEEYSKYRIGGSPNTFQLFISEEDFEKLTT